MIQSYRAKTWKTGNSIVVTVPKKYRDKTVEVLIREIDVLPDMRSMIREEMGNQAGIAAPGDQKMSPPLLEHLFGRSWLLEPANAPYGALEAVRIAV